jgi:hypothetical protein
VVALLRLPVFVSMEDGHIAQPWSAEWLSAVTNYYGNKVWVWFRSKPLTA